jgi:exosome complex component RRP43
VRGSKLNLLASRSKIVDLQSLCIAEGQAAWVLYADIVFLNYEGNAIDAALAAFMAALKNSTLLSNSGSQFADILLTRVSARLPKATYYESESTVRATPERSILLNIKRTLVASTFGIFDGYVLNQSSLKRFLPPNFRCTSQHILADPTDDEESVLSTQITIIIDTVSGDLCGTFKPGGVPLPKETIESCLIGARERANEVASAIALSAAATA